MALARAGPLSLPNPNGTICYVNTALQCLAASGMQAMLLSALAPLQNTSRYVCSLRSALMC
jgi:hypothetical protein